MLEANLMWTELNKNLNKLFADVYFNTCIILHATIFKRSKFITLRVMQNIQYAHTYNMVVLATVGRITSLCYRM